ncbi:MAG TPA: ATP-binding protein [Anaerolineales bacterium]|nr:ATP-binding protein [Anaerolineales bacterium]
MFFERPYAGFSWDTQGRVVHVDVQASLRSPRILLGDQLVKVGPVSWEQFRADYGLQLFRGARAGESIPVVVERGGQQVALDWIYPGRNLPEFFDQLLSVVWYGLFFWVIGTDCLVNVRPKGPLRSLGVASNYLTATWLIMLANVAAYHIWYGPYVLRFAAWMSAPCYVLFHWHWPRPLGRLPRLTVALAFVSAALLAAADCLRWLPEVAHLWALGATCGAILVLLAAHAIRSPADRAALSRLLGLIVLGALPLLALPLLNQVLEVHQSRFVGLVGLPLVGTGYFATIFRNQLGSLQWRAHRVVTVYSFVTVLSLLMLPVLVLVGARHTTPAITVVFAGLAGLIATLVTLAAYPPFQSFIERRLLGLRHGSRELLARHAWQVAASGSEPALNALLRDEILPSLLVWKFAYVQVEEGKTRNVLLEGVSEEEVPVGQEVQDLVEASEARAGQPAKPPSSAFSWIDLVVPLRLENRLRGVWLLGRGHDQAGFARGEIALIRSLAAQSAVGRSNVLQAERLRALYQANVTRNEEERLQLARELHDQVLNQMSALMIGRHAPQVSSGFQQGYQSVVDQLRDVIAGLRPAMLSHGLMAALQALSERSPGAADGGAPVQLEWLVADVRYPPEVELHLYRILEESLANALRHAHARRIWIRAQGDAAQAVFVVEDNGQGFALADGGGLESLVAKKHFGLAGLLERGNLIGAAVKIESTPGFGTRIQVSWPSGPS